MRICLYTDTALPKMGGQEMVVDALARQLQALGHDIVVFAPHPRLPLRARDRELPYPVVRHPRFISTRYLVDWYRVFLYRLYRRFRFDVLHCHGICPPGYLACRWAASLAVPVVITSHGGDLRVDGIRQCKPIVRRRQTHAIGAADALVAISRFTEQGFLEWGADPSQIVNIPNGVHPESFAQPVARPSDLDASIIPGDYALFLGRLVRRKGVDVALTALPSIPSFGKVRLVVAGAGDELSSLQQLARQRRIDDRVRFVGATFGDTKTYLVQNALCTVMPSRVWEAFPLVVLESFAAGTPVLGTQVPGLEDLIEPGKNGWLVPPESPDALAETLTEAFRTPEQCQVLGRQARDIAQTYSWRRVAEQHLELYETLIARRRCSTTIIGPKKFSILLREKLHADCSAGQQPG